MADRQRPDIEVKLAPNHNEPIATVHLRSVAFVGRTRRGPVNVPVTVSSFSEFKKAFGGLWLASPLSYSVAQFFANGGESATVVRVINGGSRALIDLPAGAENLCLEARNPGSFEVLRVSVDYDGIPSQYQHLFNMTVQRLQGGGTAVVEDQEIYDQISTVAESDRFIGRVLGHSKLLRVLGKVPLRRPDSTLNNASDQIYRSVTRAGHDGDTLSGFDLLGDAGQGSGLFALSGMEFPFVVLPPPGRHHDVEPEVWSQALAFCKARDAILVVDPRREWQTAEDAINGFRGLDLHEAHAIALFPGFRASGEGEEIAYHAPSGAATGLLMRRGSERLSWEFPEGWRLRGVKRFVAPVSESEALALAQSGVNSLREINVIAKVLVGDTTLSKDDAWRSLTAARFAHFLRVSIRQGTQWAVFAPHQESLWALLSRQVARFLEKQFEWAVDSRDLENLFYVRCDATTNPPAERQKGHLNVEVGFALEHPGRFHRIMITHKQPATPTHDHGNESNP